MICDYEYTEQAYAKFFENSVFDYHSFYVGFDGCSSVSVGYYSYFFSYFGLLFSIYLFKRLFS